MFADVGPLGLVAMAVLGFLLFGPERLPGAVGKALGFLRAVREYSDGAKEQIRSELGPEFKDFEFEDLDPRAFVRKQLQGGDRLGLDEVRQALDPREEIAEVAATARGGRGGDGSARSATAPVGLMKDEPVEAAAHPPFDPDAT
ncbi:Sec-independent protein translocase subunit TatB [Streptomyces sp. NPDC047108]|uniref:Sec-independent protein translocase subunit TatB n=1 Tax=Streptomyces sp. NPDC047108 TaxID=3155025 RepID=UPI0033F57CA1